MRTLTLQDAATRTGLHIERLRRAAAAGEIQVFREKTGTGRLVRGRIYLLEASLERWFFAHVTGGNQTPDPDPEPESAPGPDIDDELLAATPPSDRFV